jgi:hypothetical protein
VTLHLTKVAVGCPDIETLERLQRARWGNALCHLTRFAPKRADELIGGSLFWIIRHRLVARQAITDIAMIDTEWGRKCRLGLAGPPIAVAGVPCRAHQGWRYLAAADAPPDLTAAEEALPGFMVRELGALWLI